MNVNSRTIDPNLTAKRFLREEIKKNYRKRVYRNKSQMNKVPNIQDQSITGWNSIGLYN